MSAEIISLGCRLNLAESERMHALLGAEDGLVVINSCAVTAEAVRQTRQAVRRARKRHPDARLLVTGCAAEVERAMFAAMPEVDGLIANAAKLDPRAWNVSQAPAAIGRTPGRTRAFVQVQNGCDHACTFCVIPQGRGPGRSRAVADVLAEIADHVAQGVGEAVLTGVDLTSWGNDLPGSPRLGDLCEAVLTQCASLPRLRLSSIDPAEVDGALFELLAGERRMMPHLHLSLQSGDDLVLKRMKRRHASADARDLVDALRSRRAEIVVGADLIAGFPTEDDAMHARSVAIIRDLDIVHGHVFPYSPRPGTPAARMPQVGSGETRRRAGELREAVAMQRGRWLDRLVGQPLTVLAEHDGTGHAENFAPIRLPPGAVAGTLLSMTPTMVAQGMLA